MKTKPWWQSKTLIVNALAAGLVTLEASTGMLQPYLPVNLYTALGVALPIINAMLRVVTRQGLAIKPESGDAA